MIQTWALVVDAYREVNSKKLFWISNGLSVLVVAVFACVGLTEKGLKVLWFDVPAPFTTALMTEAEFYKYMFSIFGVSFWLGWVCTILALVSTAGMIPDLITSGSIELMLSKPIGRLRLFVTKYLCGLMFAGVQVLLFTTASVLVIGLRGGEWLPSLFLAVPIVLMFFSYFFCVCVFLGMVTRSTVAALLFTLLFWFGLFALSSTERGFLVGMVQAEQEAKFVSLDVEATKLQLQQMKDAAAEKAANPVPAAKDGVGVRSPAKGVGGVLLEALQKAVAKDPTVRDIEIMLTSKETRLKKELEDVEWWNTWHQSFLIARFALPKTDETKELLVRTIAKDATMKRLMAAETSAANRPSRGPRADQIRAQRVVEERLADRTVPWILGTSLGFEAVVLLLTGWIFCRRDF